MIRLNLENRGLSRTDLETAGQERLTDAFVLRQGNCLATAYAYGLYALEIALKARTCRHLGIPQLPKAFHVHELTDLLVLAGLESQLNDPANAPVRANWNLVVTGQTFRVEDLRYDPNIPLSQQQVDDLLHQYLQGPDGVLTWPKKLP